MPIIVMPMETMTNHAIACSLRCNFDDQSLLYLPPRSVLKLRRMPNIGPKPEYAHMERKEGDLQPKWLLDVAGSPADSLLASRGSDDAQVSEDIDACEVLLEELKSEFHSAFQDARSTGFHINEYTTKVNALGDKLLDGLRRASEKVLRQEDAQKPNLDQTAHQEQRNRIKAVLKKLVYLMNTLQVKSGSELVFPMLFDHLSFSTHKTWEMNMKVPYAKALSSWESYFKATLKTLRQNATFAMKIGFLWPSRGDEDGPHQELPAGWLMQEKKQELTVNMQSAARAAAAEADDPTDSQTTYTSAPKAADSHHCGKP